MEQTPLRYERRDVSNLSGSKEPPAGRPPTASPAQAGRGWKRGAAEGAGGCPCMGDAASVRRQSHQRLRIGLFCHRQKSRRERYVVRGDVLRAWGLEPQRITAREPKSRMSTNSIMPAYLIFSGAVSFDAGWRRWYAETASIGKLMGRWTPCASSGSGTAPTPRRV